jgi:hypothetical protein
MVECHGRTRWRPTLLGWSQAGLARASRISEPTIKRLEAAGGELGARAKTIVAIRDALGPAGVEFLEEADAGRGATADMNNFGVVWATPPRRWRWRI